MTPEQAGLYALSDAVGRVAPRFGSFMLLVLRFVCGFPFQEARCASRTLAPWFLAREGPRGLAGPFLAISY